MKNEGLVKNPLEYKHGLTHELYLALNVLCEENKMGPPSNDTMRFAVKVLARYRLEQPKIREEEESTKRKMAQALSDIIRALYLCEAPHWYQSRRWDVAAKLAEVQSIMESIEKELHARSKS